MVQSARDLCGLGTGKARAVGHLPTLRSWLDECNATRMRQSWPMLAWPMLAAASWAMVLSACRAFPGGNSMAGGSAGGPSAASGGSAGAVTVENQAGQRDTGAAGAQEQAGAPATGQAGAGTSGSSAGGSAANGGAAGDQPFGDSIVNVTFDQLPLGKYTLAQVASEYVYYPDQASSYADDFPWTASGQLSSPVGGAGAGTAHASVGCSRAVWTPGDSE
jgi:hypothetical protein